MNAPAANSPTVDLAKAFAESGVGEMLDQLERARQRQAVRLFESRDRPLAAEDLITIEAPEILASRVFKGGIGRRSDCPEEAGA